MRHRALQSEQPQKQKRCVVTRRKMFPLSRDASQTRLHFVYLALSVLLITRRRQLQSLETEIDNLRQKVEGIELFLDGQSRSKHHIDDPTASERGKVQ